MYRRKVVMGYSVKAVKSKHRNWRLLVERNVETGAKRVRKYDSIPEDKLGLHGFHSEMTLEDARRKASTLNRLKEEQRHVERKVKITEEMAAKELRDSLIMSDEVAFRAWCLKEHRINLDEGKLGAHWRAAKAVLRDLAVLPPDYYDARRRIYHWFLDKTLSVEYLKKVLRFVNLYGRYYGKTYKAYFEDVPYPTGKDREDINDAWHEDPDNRSKAALPLTPGALKSAHSKLLPEHYRWLYLSLWLGLRPNEVDGLKDPKRFKTSQEGKTTILHVYQSKLKGIARDKRWKLIPLLEDEQKVIPAILEEEFRRPLVKTISAHFGPGHNTYSGRKGFETLMRDRGHPFDYVSSWLGHQSLDRTWKSYTDRTRARYDRTE